jgi:hypothetical protein
MSFVIDVCTLIILMQFPIHILNNHYAKVKFKYTPHMIDLFMLK